MHFWIDKRSQACGFGRARVAASLSGTGFDFGHPPRRMGGKSMVTPIHRFQSVDCRPYIHRQNHHSNQANNSQSHQRHQNHQSQGQPQQHSHHHQQHRQHQPNVRHANQSHNSSRTHHLYRQNQQPHQIETNAHCRESNDCVAIQQFGQSHALELEQGTLGIHSIGPSRAVITDDNNSSSVNDVVAATNHSQILPSHLKCGMWASFALATVFLAVFQGTVFEVFILCAFSATFFLAACAVSLCRRPRNLNISTPQISNAPNLSEIEHIPQMDQHNSHLLQLPELNSIDALSAPPPPYHIAILAIDNSKDIIIDESPPPSYDKILI